MAGVAVLSAFALAALLSAFAGKFIGLNTITIDQFYARASDLGKLTNDFNRDLSGKASRPLDYLLPPSAHVFMLNILGEENNNNLGFYYYLAYYLFPRAVDISLGQPPRFTPGAPPSRTVHYQGTPPRSVDELKGLGYDLVVDATPEESSKTLLYLWLTPRPTTPGKPHLYPYTGDILRAGLLPLLVAVFGAAIVRLLFPHGYPQLGWGEKGATGLATGMLIVGQLVFGLRLLGVAAERVIWFLLLGWAGYILFRQVLLWRRNGWPPPRMEGWHPAWLGLIPLGILFFVLFRLASQLGLLEYDAVAGWAFKAKILHYASGHELIRHFSNPAFAHAHLDYPPLVPALHALTYGINGRVNEFVTKYWPVWMLFLLVVGAMSICRWPKHNPVLGLALAVSLAFMPLCLDYALCEGATMPMLFFATLAGMQIALAMLEHSRERMRLGILILAGAALCKFEGMILLALWLGVLLLRKETRTLLQPDREGMVLAGLIGVCFLPYIALRLQIPVLTPESKWMSSLVEHPGQVLGQFPKALLSLLGRQCFGGEVLRWASTDRVTMEWSGEWNGLKSLFNELTLGFVWVGVAWSVVLYRSDRGKRMAVVQFGAVFILFACALSLVTSALPETLDNLGVLLSFSDKSTGGRYFSPVLCAWVAGLVMLAARPTQREATSMDQQ